MPFLQAASTAGAQIDAVFWYIFLLSAAFLFGITAVIIYFVLKYSRKRHPKGEDIEGNTWLESVWTITPTVLFLTMFYYGWTNYGYLRTAPRDAMEITVTARQWAWSFKYPNGRRTTELVLALNKPVKTTLESLDVIHGFFIPAFRIKEDVVPGKNNYTWFTPTQLGTFDIECTVICGVNHAQMLSKAIVVPVADFQAWYFGDENAALPGQVKPAPPAVETAPDQTIALLQSKDCLTCHSVDGSEMVGPTFKGMFGQKQTVVTDGQDREITVDENRLTLAIQKPGVEVVKGYPPVMPETALTDLELRQIVNYIKNLK
jgi:cytochrome c oxidase subunit II